MSPGKSALAGFIRALYIMNLLVHPPNSRPAPAAIQGWSRSRRIALTAGPTECS